MHEYPSRLVIQMNQKHKLTLRFANNIIEHLGVKLYQNKPTNVIAEYVANGWDAGANLVEIQIDDTNGSKSIAITDDGEGMSEQDLSKRFLVIGANRRRVGKTQAAAKNRKPMGRKGIGKLAGFGIANIIDVITCSAEEGCATKFYWLRFNLDTILKQSQTSNDVEYEPKVLGTGSFCNFASAVRTSDCNRKLIESFEKNFKLGHSGTCIILQNVQLAQNFSIKRLKNGLANRFAINLLQNEMILRINNEELSGIDRLVQLQDFSIGTPDELKTEEISVNGKLEKIQYWIGFVDLAKTPDWTIDNAGVAIYAHNKIVQDRPFYFGNRGNEIHSRYMMGFVYADWLDDFDEDLVSTDRNSINWEASQSAALFDWGKEAVLTWLKKYADYRADRLTQEVDKDIEDTPAYNEILPVEAAALKSLLQKIYPRLDDNGEARKKVCTTMADAWVRKPMRELIKALWDNLGNSDMSVQNISTYTSIISKLKETLVPELLDLGITASMRLYAVRQMLNNINNGASETHLQRLIEDFPWILNPNWECLTANQEIKTIVKKLQGAEGPTNDFDNKRPDFVFVFLSDTENKKIVIIELKGAELDRQITASEYRQLARYIDEVGDRIPNANIEGLLIGHDIPSQDANFINRKDIRVAKWRDILNEAAIMNEDLLKTIIVPNESQRKTYRMSIISSFAGSDLSSMFDSLRKKNLMNVPDYDQEKPLRKLTT